jgi:hypothetical protein
MFTNPDFIEKRLKLHTSTTPDTGLQEKKEVINPCQLKCNCSGKLIPPFGGT